jgi:parallel beta-helix repeat protein
MKVFLFLGGLFFACPVAVANSLHVSPERLRSVPAEKQFRTIQQAANVVAPGDVVRIHAGIYREAVVVQKSGTAQNPIRFEAVPGANVVVTGVGRLTKWRKENGNVFSTRWPFRFIPESKTDAFPDDEYHRLIGRAEQVLINRQALRQVLERSALSPGSFYVDFAAKRLFILPPHAVNFATARVEASTRSVLWNCKGARVIVKGIRFRYAGNRAQQGAVSFQGEGDVAENCAFERMNSIGAAFGGWNQIARGCTFQDNGQLGFAANHAHNFLMTGCTIRNNNTKGFNRQWEAGGDKIVLSRNVILENSSFVSNHGSGIWFDIGNENCEVRNCLIADNEDAGIFYEISYGLHAHDNVVTGNGFASTPGVWGAQAGIVLSSSPNCIVERNLIVGNREGFNFREQSRTTTRIDNPDVKHEEAISNHDERISDNVIAYNRDAQTRGWFDMIDDRHWPERMRSAGSTGSSLEALHFTMQRNVYARDNNEPLFIWGTEWRRHMSYSTIAEIQAGLGLEQESQLLPIQFREVTNRDFRLPPESPVFRMECYPRGRVPDVQLGALKN